MNRTVIDFAVSAHGAGLVRGANHHFDKLTGSERTPTIGSGDREKRRFAMLKYLVPQIALADVPPMIFVAFVGGLIAAWVIARRLIPGQPRDWAYRQICAGVLCVLIFGISFGLVGYGYGLWCGPEADYSAWIWMIRELNISDPWSFVRVAYIHHAGYLGGLIGLIVALLLIRPNRKGLIDKVGSHRR